MRSLAERLSRQATSVTATAHVVYQRAFTLHDRRRHQRLRERNGGSCRAASMSATSFGVRRSGDITPHLDIHTTPALRHERSRYRPGLICVCHV